MKQHKHCELIKAWADGAKIQFKALDTHKWCATNKPTWDVHMEFRIVPIEYEITRESKLY